MDYWKFTNSIGEGGEAEATLYIYGDIVLYNMGNWNYPDDVVPDKFRRELDACKDVSTIHVRINSGGGSVFAAYAIMNLLKTHKAKIITYNDGIAASAATIIAMAGDKIVTALGSIWMIHLPATYAYGNEKEIQKSLDVLKTITMCMIDIYHAKTGIDKTELQAMLSEETWLTGTEAKEKGLCDEVTAFKVSTSLNSNTAMASINGLPFKLDSVRNRDKFVAMLGAPEQGTSGADNSTPPVDKPTAPDPTSVIGGPANDTKSKKEDPIMTLEELKAKYPDIYKAIFDEGVARGVKDGTAQGVTDERNRMKEIDSMALPGMDTLTNKAKYETGISASEYAVEIVKAQKAQGIKYLSDAKDDAADSGDVPPATPPANDAAKDAEETKALLAMAAERGKTIRR